MQQDDDSLYGFNPEEEFVSPEKQERIINEVRHFMSAHKKFSMEQQITCYYLLSVRWFERWKVYVSYEFIIKEAPPGKYFGCGKLPDINEDIVDKNYRPDVQFVGEYAHYNVRLKPEIQEGRDFIFLSEEMWNIIKRDNCWEIKRFVEKYEEGERVQSHLQSVNIVPIFNNLLKDVEKERLSELLSYGFQVSCFLRFQTLIQLIKNSIVQDVNNKNYHLILDNFPNTKLWFIPPETNKKQLTKYVFDGCKTNSTFRYRLYLDEGEQVIEDKQIYQLPLDENSLLILQMKGVYQDWCFFNENHLLYLTCSSCLKKTSLNYFCTCMHAAYCSKPCRRKDKDYHKFKCPYEAESDIEESEFQMTEESRKGVVGLKNLGNTCFMNAGIQCIAHIPELVEYFLNKNYIKHINTGNFLGTKGKLSICFAKILRQLQYGVQPVVSPIIMKKSIQDFQPSFAGYGQHDCGEFITYMLDGLHQDLNMVKKKPYCQGKDYEGGSDEMISKEQWQGFKSRNKSKIVDLMYGQFRSVLDCPRCDYRSIQFDPFLMCSLPIMSRTMKKIDIVFLRDHLIHERMTIWFDLLDEWTIFHVFQQVRKKIEKPQARMLCYASDKLTCEPINERKPINQIRLLNARKTVFVRELEMEEDENGRPLILRHSISGKLYSSDSQRISLVPLRLYMINRQTPLKELHHMIMRYYSRINKIHDYEAEVVNVKKVDQFLRLITAPMGLNYRCCYCSKKRCQGCEVPYSEVLTFDKFTMQVEDEIVFDLFWRQHQAEVEAAFKSFTEEKMSDDPKKCQNDLYDCLNLFSEHEVLEGENKWFCPKCRDFVRATKQIHIYKAPKILILCLKRFKRHNFSQQKSNMFVNFPLINLDLSNYVLNDNLPGEWPVDTNYECNRLLYDLFAVSNHEGKSGQVGHYTAFCKNAETAHWFSFDDNEVEELVSAEQLVTNHAYILFYRRKEY